MDEDEHDHSGDDRDREEEGPPPPPPAPDGGGDVAMGGQDDAQPPDGIAALDAAFDVSGSGDPVFRLLMAASDDPLMAFDAARSSFVALTVAARSHTPWTLLGATSAELDGWSSTELAAAKVGLEDRIAAISQAARDLGVLDGACNRATLSVELEAAEGDDLRLRGRDVGDAVSALATTSAAAWGMLTERQFRHHGGPDHMSAIAFFDVMRMGLSSTRLGGGERELKAGDVAADAVRMFMRANPRVLRSNEDCAFFIPVQANGADTRAYRLWLTYANFIQRFAENSAEARPYPSSSTLVVSKEAQRAVANAHADLTRHVIPSTPAIRDLVKCKAVWSIRDGVVDFLAMTFVPHGLFHDGSFRESFRHRMTGQEGARYNAAVRYFDVSLAQLVGAHPDDVDATSVLVFTHHDEDEEGFGTFDEVRRAMPAARRAAVDGLVRVARRAQAGAPVKLMRVDLKEVVSDRLMLHTFFVGQNYDREAMEYAWCFFARQVFFLQNECDKWKVHLQFIGPSNTGKSCMLMLVGEVIENGDVAAVNQAGFEERFGASQLGEKLVAIIDEASPNNSRLQKALLNPWADGFPEDHAVKNGKVRRVLLPPLIVAGNVRFYPPGDQSASSEKRVYLVPMLVKHAPNAEAQERLRRQAPESLFACGLCYHKIFERHVNNPSRADLPPILRAAQEQWTKSAPLNQFLDQYFDRDPSRYMQLAEFQEAAHAFATTTKLIKREELTTENIKETLLAMGISCTRGVLRYADGTTSESDMIMGVRRKVFGVDMALVSRAGTGEEEEEEEGGPGGGPGGLAVFRQTGEVAPSGGGRGFHSASAAIR